MPEAEEVQLLTDVSVVAEIAELVNRVYADSEKGLWRGDVARTTPGELDRMVRAGTVAVARHEGRITGCVRVARCDERTAEFGMLAADRAYRGTGVGRELVRFAERHSREAGLATMRLDLLMPRDWSHPSKEFLAAWYTRMGYRRHHVHPVEPEFASLLATPCDFVTFQKAL